MSQIVEKVHKGGGGQIQNQKSLHFKCRLHCKKWQFWTEMRIIYIIDKAQMQVRWALMFPIWGETQIQNRHISFWDSSIMYIIRTSLIKQTSYLTFCYHIWDSSLLLLRLFYYVYNVHLCLKLFFSQCYIFFCAKSCKVCFCAKNLFYSKYI